MKNPHPVFVAIVAVIVGAFAFFRLDIEKPRERPIAEEGTASRWMKEIRASISSERCRFSVGEGAQATSTEVEREAVSLERRARLLPEESLPVSRRLQQLIVCSEELAKDQRDSLAKMRDRLLDGLDREIRVRVARLRRAQLDQRREEAARVIEELDELLDDHEGSVKDVLVELRARYR